MSDAKLWSEYVELEQENILLKDRLAEAEDLKSEAVKNWLASRARLAEAEGLLRDGTVGLPYWCERVAEFLRSTDSASGLCQWCGTEHGLGCACAITPADQPDGGPDEEDGPWAEGWAERSGTPDQQSAREGLDELTRMAQEDGLYDMPTDKT
jgi:hypothetical protein